MLWMGKPVADCSKDELIEIIRHLSGELQRYREPGMAQAIAVGKVEMIRRGA